MQPSAELRIAQAKQDAATPQKQFTRVDIEKHDKEGDCWLVIDNKVYDVTSVLAWHPGGKAAIMAHAAKCHYETTEEFSSIHDDFAYQKLQGMDGPLSLNIRTSPVTDKHCRMHSRRSNRENIQVHQADGGISSQGAGEERSATGRQQPPGVAETPLGARQASRPEGSLRRHAHLHV
jgi:hypothetical protein